MPIFVYRAVTNNGTIVRNKVEDINRKSLIKKLKRNNLTPINIVQVNRIVSKRTQKQKRNISDVNDIVKDIDAGSYFNATERPEKVSLLKRMGLNITTRITTRDLVIFTQDLYLLKKQISTIFMH